MTITVYVRRCVLARLLAETVDLTALERHSAIERTGEIEVDMWRGRRAILWRLPWLRAYDKISGGFGAGV